MILFTYNDSSIQIAEELIANLFWIKIIMNKNLIK